MLLCGPTLAQPDLKVAIDSLVSIDELKQHVKTLASDEFGGRGTGQEGEYLAAEYIVKEFKKIGLEPAFELLNTYHQFFYTPGKLSKRKPISLTWAGRHIDNNNKIFLVNYLYGENWEIKNCPVIVVTAKGLTEPSILQNLKDNISGKFLLLLPDPNPSREFSLRTTMKFIKDFKGKGLIMPAEKARISNEKLIMGTRGGFLAPKENNAKDFLPILYLAESDVRKILKLKRKAYKKIAETAWVNEVDEPIWKLQISGVSNASANICGMIKSPNPNAKHILIGAHYDHVGKGFDPRFSRKFSAGIYNGADDNASGTAALIESARTLMALKKLGWQPKYHYIFVGFAAEELGLIGSNIYAKRPAFPLKEMRYMLNMDMVGRPDVKRNGEKRYKLMTDMKLYLPLKKLAKDFNIQLAFDPPDTSNFNNVYFRSDHYSFASKGVPFMFFSGPEHQDYHKPTDDYDKINYEGLTGIAKLVAYTLLEY